MNYSELKQSKLVAFNESLGQAVSGASQNLLLLVKALAKLCGSWFIFKLILYPQSRDTCINLFQVHRHLDDRTIRCGARLFNVDT